jgi:endoglucanase
MNEQQAELLFRLLSQPTAPFREEHVSATVIRALDAAGVPHCDDPHGNLVVGVGSRAAYTRLIRARSREPVRVFVAHMDHPGFHGVRWSGPRTLKIKWHGGSPVKHVNGAAVWLANDAGYVTHGVLRNVKLHKLGYAIDTAEVHFKAGDLAKPRPAADELFGGFRFRAPVWAQGKRVYTKAADDLIGVYCIASTAIELFKRPNARRAPFIGLCTRAEEVGFIGALAHFESGWLKRARRPIVCVSLEASRTLPGAIVGNGPVVRMGDRRAVFDGAGMQLLTELAEKHLPKKYQRRVMDGGTCEGTAATAYGYTTLAMSVPLGNYHNQGFEGGPDCRKPQGPAPEFVHLDDLEGQRRLCLELMRPNLNWSDPWAVTRKRLLKNFREYRSLL